jgi:tetratricopeptide (TPR) repeat protein
MRRSILFLLLVTGALVAWVFWRPARSAPRPTGPQPSAASPAEDGAREAAPARRLLAGVDPRLPAHRGLCGTEVEPPGRGLAPRRVPPELRALGGDVPTAAAVAAAVSEWGIDTGDLDLGVVVDGATLQREVVERSLAGSGATTTGSDGDPGSVARLAMLRALGRPREALAEASRDYASDPGLGTALTFTALLDDVGRSDEARRVLDTELARASSDHERAWLQAQLGFLCATGGDRACAERASAALEREGGSEGLARFTRAVERTFSGHLEEARAGYQAALEESPDFATTNNLAEIDGCLGRQADARRQWLAALDRSAEFGRRAGVLAGLGMTYLREGEVAPAWILGGAALAAGGDGSHSADARLLLSLAALTMGDLDEARAQVARAARAAPDDDLLRRRCFAHPAEAAALRALGAEARGDLDGARRAWHEVARSGHAALALSARQALAVLCG